MDDIGAIEAEVRDDVDPGRHNYTVKMTWDSYSGAIYAVWGSQAPGHAAG